MDGKVLAADAAMLEQPAKNGPVRGAIATTLDGRDITRGFVQPDFPLLPMDGVLQARGGSYEIYRDVLRDDRVQSCVQQRRDALVSREWVVEPGGDKRVDRQAADSLRAQLDAVGFMDDDPRVASANTGDGFDDLTRKMWYGVYYGYAVAECLWGRDGREVVLDNVKVRDRRRFVFDGAFRLRLLTSANANGALLPGRKFWTFSCGADHDDEPYGLGLAHWLYWPVLFKKNGMKFWLKFTEKFAAPTGVGEFPLSASDADKAKLLEAVQAIQQDSGMIIPQGMVIRLLEASRSGTGDYESLYRAMQGIITTVVLSQTATTEGTAGKLGNEDSQETVKKELVSSDDALICGSFRAGPARWLTEWNYPGAKVPWVRRVLEEAEDLNLRAQRDKLIFDMGFRPTLDYVTETYGGKWEPRAAAASGNPAAGGIPLPGVDGTAAAFAEGEPGTLPALYAQRLGEQMQPVLQDLLEPVRRLVMNAKSFDEIRDGLYALYPEMDGTAFTLLLAKAMAAANLAGRVAIEEGR